jgi:hypothetical protein
MMYQDTMKIRCEIRDTEMGKVLAAEIQNAEGIDDGDLRLQWAKLGLQVAKDAMTTGAIPMEYTETGAPYVDILFSLDGHQDGEDEDEEFDDEDFDPEFDDEDEEDEDDLEFSKFFDDLTSSVKKTTEADYDQRLGFDFEDTDNGVEPTSQNDSLFDLSSYNFDGAFRICISVPQEYTRRIGGLATPALSLAQHISKSLRSTRDEMIGA